MIPKKVVLFAPLLVMSHPIMVSFIHTFMMVLYPKPLIDLNAKTLSKTPLNIPFSLVICIGRIKIEHFLDA